MWSRLLVSFDRVQRLDASLRGDSYRPPCLCLGYSQRILEAGLIFDPPLGVPDPSTRGRPSNLSGGPVCTPLRFLWRCVPALPCSGRKSRDGSPFCLLGTPFQEGVVVALRHWGICNVLSQGVRRPLGGAFTKEVTALAGSACWGWMSISIAGSLDCYPFRPP